MQFFLTVVLAIIAILIFVGFMVVLCRLKGDVKATFKIPFVAFGLRRKNHDERSLKVQKQLLSKPSPLSAFLLLLFLFVLIHQGSPITT